MPAEKAIFKVDSFTDAPFGGNPAGVCLLDEEVTDEWMQAVAREMNVSETAFVRPKSDGFSIRFFTPFVEVPLCGHATLATTHILYEERRVPEDLQIDFDSKSGPLASRREGDWLLLDFPADAVSPGQLPSGVEDALGAAPEAVYRSEKLNVLLLEYGSEEQVRSMKPNFPKLCPGGMGVSVTAKSGSPDYDFVSRFFTPELGIDEDPVTGAAHTVLGPFWAARLGKTELVARQVSSRGGLLRVRSKGDRVDILGKAVTILRGELTV
jgi:predicted PhzF superfamily epimerase YddE/YHI9